MLAEPRAQGKAVCISIVEKPVKLLNGKRFIIILLFVKASHSSGRESNMYMYFSLLLKHVTRFII